MKKSLTLVLGLLLYSTTSSAKTMVMECFIPNLTDQYRYSIGIFKLDTNAGDNSKDLFTVRVDGNWKGCPDGWDCIKGDDSVKVTVPTNQTSITPLVYDFKTSITRVYDFKFLTFTEKGSITTKSGDVTDVNKQGKCERITP